MDPYLGLALILFLTTLLVAWMKRRDQLQPRITSFVAALRKGSWKVNDNMGVICLQGPLKGQRFPFQRGRLTIGRQIGSNIVLSGALVSRQHAVLFLTADGIILRDLASTNGTWVNGQQIDQALLGEGQTFQVGPNIFLISRLGEPALSLLPPSQTAASHRKVVSPSVVQNIELDNFERLRIIGEGGAATVYLCRAYSSNELVAVKILHYSADPYFKQKFQQEGRFGLELQHPHIVRTQGTGESGGLSYIIMEYVPGGSLRDRMVRGPISIAEAVQIVGQIGLALDYAHQKKIYHRDIKPENILFSQYREAKLADFGIARFTRMRTVTQEGMLVGTPEYMSFEQAKGSEIDGRSDQYALGIVLYEMLCGVRPFRGEPLAVVGQHLNVKPTPPRQINPSIPVQFERVIMKSLEKNKNKRYPTMANMAEALGFNSRISSQPAGLSGIFRKQPGPAHFRLINTETHHQIALSEEINIVGRNNLKSPHVSRNHAQIIVRGKDVIVTDLNSKNGTYVNETRVTGQERLTPGSLVRFGPVTFRFTVD